MFLLVSFLLGSGLLWLVLVATADIPLLIARFCFQSYRSFFRSDSHLGFSGLCSVKAPFCLLVCFSNRFPGIILVLGDLSCRTGLSSSLCLAWSLFGSVYVVAPLVCVFSRYRDGSLLVPTLQIKSRSALSLGFVAGVVIIRVFPPFLVLLKVETFELFVEVDLIHNEVYVTIYIHVLVMFV